MSLRNINLENIREGDLQVLVDNRVNESKIIEYKKTLAGNSDRDKKEFLADVSSFANAAGGDLIFGIKEEHGEPVELCGLENINADDTILRLENIIRDGIEPRISGVSIRSVSLLTSNVVIIIRIPRSWALPHVVNFRNHWRFYSRNSAGKYPLDVSETGDLFRLSETTAERIRNFRYERISKIIAGETPVAIENKSKIVLHIIPIEAFDLSKRVDLSILIKEKIALLPIINGVDRFWYNFDGILSFNRSRVSHPTCSYLQIFRNGIIEALDTHILKPQNGELLIQSILLEQSLLQALPRFLKIQKQLGIEPPIFIMLSLLEVSGYTMAVGHPLDLYECNHPIEKDTILIPAIMIDTYKCNPESVMKPLFDTIWNAVGFARCMHYDEETDKWVGKR